MAVGVQLYGAGCRGQGMGASIDVQRGPAVQVQAVGEDERGCREVSVPSMLRHQPLESGPGADAAVGVDQSAKRDVEQLGDETVDPESAKC